VDECNNLNNLSTSERIRWKTRAEGRRDERVQLTMPVLIIHHSAAGEQRNEAISIDISESGVAFETEANLNSGNLVELVFDANEESEYRRYARLLYRFGLRYGAYFTKLD
jgi:PilZ domain